MKDAAAAGYLELRAAEGDARRREVSVTDAGVALLEQAHVWQEEVFAQLTTGWSERRRTQFRKDMLCLLERSHP